MKISLEWLSDFVDLSGIEPEVVADRLTMATAEVEGFETVERSVEGIVIAEVVSVEPVEAEAGEEARLSLATVDIGGGQTRATVTGARNVRPGIKVPFAGPGSRLASGLEISITDIGGRR